MEDNNSRELEAAVSEGNINQLIELVIRCGVESVNTNLVILACKHNQLNILEYIFGNKTTVLKCLESNVLPTNVDAKHHNAFYYAIRSGNTKLINTLINKWTDNYFAAHTEELDEVLSRAYEDLKLKNVLLSEEMEIYVEQKLINLRFFSNTLEQIEKIGDDIILLNIGERVQLLLNKIEMLGSDYSNTREIDEKFLYITKSIAQNIHILKRQLKSTYNKLPWEEIEFCLISFVSSHTKQKEINLFYLATLNVNKILKYLAHLAKSLSHEWDIIMTRNDTDNLGELPKVKREKIVTAIINNYPKFSDLYNDFRHIRDIHSLEKINYYINLALSANAKERQGHLIITRVLQVIGEYLKNTLESPKLSTITCEMLILSLPKNAREIIVDLRNSLSHAYSLSKRMAIIDKPDVDFFENVQNDIKKIGHVITDILFKRKIKTVRVLLEKLLISDSIDEIKEFAQIFKNIKINKKDADNFKITEHEKLEKLVNELWKNIPHATPSEKYMLDKMSDILKGVEAKSEGIKTDYVTGLAGLIALSITDLNEICDISNENNIQKIIKGMKFRVNQTLQLMTLKITSPSLLEIGQLAIKFSQAVTQRLAINVDASELNRIVYEIFHIVEFGINDIKYIEQLRKTLNERTPFILAAKSKQQTAASVTTGRTYSNQLSTKLSELKSILSTHALDVEFIDNLPSYKNDIKLQVAIEMLVLDIMTILGSSKHTLENNLLCLDDNTPLLTGKCLRNHLAHDNILIDILLSDPSLAIILNAKKLTDESIVMRNAKKLGKLLRDDPWKLREKYEQDLIAIATQKRMFFALEKGDFEIFKDCLKMGADVNARNKNAMSTLHFAAKGSNMEMIKYIILENVNVNVKDCNGRSPLHIAAEYGRTDVLEFFIKEMGVYIDEPDNSGKTALHIAAENGHHETVEVLLKFKANNIVQDMVGMSPLFYAIRKNHVSVAQVLLEKDANVDINEALGGFTALHEASESGHAEIARFLLQNNANVNAKNDRDWTPLHAAALNGYLDIVNALIAKGADINAKVINGCTSLYYAAENGHEDIAAVLIKHGADVDAGTTTYKDTPLHAAAKFGNELALTVLLKNKASPNMPTIEGRTPLHYAAQIGNLRIVTALIQHGVNIDAKDKTHSTALHIAIENGWKDVAQFLIRNNADVNAVIAKSRLSLLHIAAMRGQNEVIGLLIKYNAHVNANDSNRMTPLHAAALNGHRTACDILLQNKASINAKDLKGCEPIHAAAAMGHKDVIAFLLKNNANIEASSSIGTPLHSAVASGHKEIVKYFIENKALVDSRGVAQFTALHGAVEMGHKEIVQILVAKGAAINAMNSTGETPLYLATKSNYKEIVQFLIANGADVNAKNGELLLLAILGGFNDITEILIKNNARIDVRYREISTALHLAAHGSTKKIVNMLIAKGASVDSVSFPGNETPLMVAAMTGNAETAEALLAHGASVNAENEDGTPLHVASGNGHSNIVKILLKHGAKVNLRDYYYRTPVELAASRGHLEVVKILMACKVIDVNAKGRNNFRLLHLAAEENHLEVIKYLLEKGADINARNTAGSKPIHVAAREGFIDVIELFLSEGASTNELGAGNQTLLHYAAIQGHLDVAKYLIARGADVNFRDNIGLSPMHVAAYRGHKDFIDVLLKSGAFLNDTTMSSRTALQLTRDKNVIVGLTLNQQFFEAVKRNNRAKVKKFLIEGAHVDLRNSDGSTPLHYAAQNGFVDVTHTLLQNNANPNLHTDKGFTPLHYAVKHSHFKVVRELLINGAIYNAASKRGKTPLYFAVDKSITDLLTLINDSFTNIANDNFDSVYKIRQIKDMPTVQSIMRACNCEKQTLVVAAMCSNFSKVDQLKEIGQGDVSTMMCSAVMLFNQGDYQKALPKFETVFAKRKEILGPDNPGSLDIQVFIAKTLYQQGAYLKALHNYQHIYKKQKDILGMDVKDTLSTGSLFALNLHRLGRQDEALTILQQVYKKQKELLGPNDTDILETQCNLALVLDKLEKYDEALSLNREMYENSKKILGPNDASVVRSQNNIAMVLSHLGNNVEALKLYDEVYEKKKIILGINHADTLRTLNSIAGILFNQSKYQEALEAFRKVLHLQTKLLGPNHPDTLDTEYNTATTLSAQGKPIAAMKLFQKCLDKTSAVLGSNHPTTSRIVQHIKDINFEFKIQGGDATKILMHLQTDINIAASNGDVQAVKHLLESGCDANEKDIHGRTALHFAVNNENISVVKLLLENGACANQVTNKGNTPLHTATFKGNREIVQLLLEHADQTTFSEFINAKTVASGATALHVSAKNGTMDVTKTLLKNGAVYNIKNNDRKTPRDLTQDDNIRQLFEVIVELFNQAKTGNREIIKKLESLEPDTLVIATNAQDIQGNTILQVIKRNRHNSIAIHMLAMLNKLKLN